MTRNDAVVIRGKSKLTQNRFPFERVFVQVTNLQSNNDSSCSRAVAIAPIILSSRP